MSSDPTSELSGELNSDLADEVRTQLPVEVPVESRTKLWSDLSIDWTSDMQVEWSIDMPTEWWVELWIEVPSKVPNELPVELPSPGLNAWSGCESGRERIGKWVTAAERNRGERWNLKLHHNRREAANRESGWTKGSVNRGRCFCQRTSAFRELHRAGFHPPRRAIARRANRSPYEGSDHRGSASPAFLVRRPERRQLRCRIPRQLSLHYDSADGLGLSLCFGFEVPLSNPGILDPSTPSVPSA